jgi:hypothetical protein
MAGALLSSGAVYAQNDFDKYLKEQRAVFERYKLQEQDNFNRYRDSINREYAAYLEKQWEVFKLQKEEPPIKNPVPEPPVTYRDKSYSISYNKNLVDFYASYPCVEFSVYAEAPLDPETLQGIESQIAQGVRDKSQEEAVNLLLHFVQLYFEYKTDAQQFGYERWFFAEETIASSYSDCEDRSILFVQLVRRILGMKVGLVYYPGIHLATAVKFDSPQTDGDYVLLDGEKYLICDPTYRRAGLGAAMPKLDMAILFQQLNSRH